MHTATVVLLAGLALCNAESYHQFLGPWEVLPEDASRTAYIPVRQKAAMPLYERILQARPRRSLQPGAPQFPAPGDQQQADNGVQVSATRERGVGTVVDAQGRTNVWRSSDGNTRVDAHGRWTRVYDGPAHGQRSHSAGIVFSHRWR